MRSDTVIIKSGGEGIDRALETADTVAEYKSLSPENKQYLRLLAEEMTAMFRAIAGEVEAKFWIEDDGEGRFELHLSADTMMTGEMRREFLSVSSTGRNEAAKGFWGMIRQLYETAFEPTDDSVSSVGKSGWISAGAGTEATPFGDIPAEIWSLNAYKESLKENSSEEEWDELEKSIVSKFSDEVKIAIRKGNAELIVIKKFG